VLILTGAFVSCATFSGSDQVQDSRADGGPADTSDSGANDAPPIDERDGSVSTTDGGTVSKDSGSIADAANVEDGGFCAGYPNAILCFDFDGTVPTYGLKLGTKNGSAGIGPAFEGGSAPSALVLGTNAAGAQATATPATIDLTSHSGKTIEIDLAFSVPTPLKTIEYIARLNFQSQSSPIAFDSAGNLQCGASSFNNVPAGVHALRVFVPVVAGQATTYSCMLDGVASPSASVSPSGNLSFEIGDVNSGGGSFSVSYDNLLVTAQ
jgi:hypothetical protein